MVASSSRVQLLPFRIVQVPELLQTQPAPSFHLSIVQIIPINLSKVLSVLQHLVEIQLVHRVPVGSVLTLSAVCL